MQRKKRLLWHLYPSYLLITVIALLAVTLYASNSFRQFCLERTAADLRARTKLIEEQVLTLLANREFGRMNKLCRELGLASATRITMIAPSGKVLADSEKDPAEMDNHSDRPEVMSALNGQAKAATRYSYTLRENMMYMAIPLTDNGEIIGVLRTSIPLASIGEALKNLYMKVALGGLIVVIAAAAVSLYVSRRISLPIEIMKQGAESYARGEFDFKLPPTKSQEIGSLSESLNKMAHELDERIRTISRQSNQQNAILSSMSEGVLAVDKDERVMSINNSAAVLFGTDPEKAQGKGLQDVVRNINLYQFVKSALSGGGPVEGEIMLSGNGERFLQAHGSVLSDAKGNNIGALVVLNDITRLRRLEIVRRDFVANVSHELRTPITSIKGFVETLLDGAMENKSELVRFLEIIANQTDRLDAIINDLLDLSKLERIDDRAAIKIEEALLKPVLEEAIHLCSVKAIKKNMDISLKCSDTLAAKINTPLMEQAIVNLLDNAIKFSDEEKTVFLEAEQGEKEITITVRDCGGGIKQEHLPRLFERFYRVDKARSRKMGGTGLGLAIVKHIVQIHNGSVSVDSTFGKGSTFKIHIPS